jgi:ABC-2 type transport system permease protein
MSTIAVRSASSTPRLAPIGRTLYKQTRSQWHLLLRQPAVSLIAIILPVLLYVLFGLPHASQAYSSSVSMGAYMLVGLGAYGVGLIMVFTFGATVAMDRGQKNDLLMRATPLPPAVDIAARGLVAIVFAMITLMVLFAVAIGAGVRLQPATWLAIMTYLVAGSLPMLGLGLAIAYLISPNAAVAIVNVIYMLLAFASGFLVPMSQLPNLVQQLAVYLPTYHYAQLAWAAIGVSTESVLVSASWLSGYAVVFFGIALWAYRRDASRRTG